MSYNWEAISTYFLRNIQSKFKNENVSFSCNFEQGIELFRKILAHKEENETDGIGENIIVAIQDALFDISQDRQTNNFCFLETKLEPYLGKILSLLNKQSYIQIQNNKQIYSRLLPYINTLGLNPKGHFFEESKISELESKGAFAGYVCSAYVFRNIEAHESEAIRWTDDVLRKRTMATIVTYLLPIFKHYNILRLAVETNDFTSYIKSEIEKVKGWQSRFVHIEGKEQFAGIDLYAKEVLDGVLNGDEEDESISEETQKIREGTIDSLRKSIAEKAMIILGEVGMGKSTTLQYLHLQDSQLAMSGSNQQIPIYLELKNFTEKDTILQKIIDKLQVDEIFITTMLKQGKFNICLDGLNEIEKGIKTKVFTQIRNILESYSDNNFILTSRPQHYNREFDDVNLNRKIPVFVLQKMKDNQISEFLNKNGKSVSVYIQKEIGENRRLKEIIQTPLMLMMLIAVVRREGNIPNEKGKIIRSFMYSLYDWECRQNIDFDRDVYHILLCYLGYETRNLSGSNSGLDRDEYVLPVLEDRKRQLGLDINLLEFLKKSIDLNILVKDGNQFSFSHELFQEYYAAEFLHLL